jgi:ABC-type microcin C transport system permease subunit YejB
MPGFITRRLLLLVPTVFGVVTLVFFFIHMIPGDPAEGHFRKAEATASCEGAGKPRASPSPITIPNDASIAARLIHRALAVCEELAERGDDA